MNQDLSKSKYQPGHFYEGKNLKLVTEDGLSTGSIVNKKGNKLNFVIPNLAETVYGEMTIPAQEDLHIIGFGEVKDYLIIFTTNNHQDAPTNSVGQIWAVEYKDNSDNPLGLVNGELDPSTHLIYNNYVNFSTKNPIGDEVVGRYETSTIIRIYWTDFYNALRTINIADPEASLLAVDKLSIKPDTVFSQPIITGLGNGSVPAGSMVQIAYRLLSNSGVQTAISPASVLIPITEYDEKTSAREDFTGSSKGRDNNRSVEFKINDIDTEFDVIELFAVVYEDKDSPVVYKFDESNLSDTGSYIGTYTGGTQNLFEITLQEYNMTNVGFDRCKSISYKDNRLVAGNVFTNEVDIDFDARAYRFNSSGVAYLKKDVNTPITTLNSTDYTVISSPNAFVEEEEDCLNIYNIEDRTVNPLYPAQNKFLYKSNGYIVGGEGPNISYEFITDEFLLDDSSDVDSIGGILTGSNTVPHHYKANIRNGQSDFLDPGIISINGSDNSVPLDNEWRDFQSPLFHAYRAGYKRGEVYRFGIQFLTKQGIPTFVKWIGDIKFPETELNAGAFGMMSPLSGTGLTTYTSGDPRVSSYGKTMGIKFSVDLSSISEEISGFRIVRAEREINDMSRIGTAALASLDTFGNPTRHLFQDIIHEFLASGTYTENVSSSNYLIMNELPSRSTLNTARNSYNIISPLSLSLGNVVSPGDFTYLRKSAIVEGKMTAHYSTDTFNRVGCYLKAKDFKQTSLSSLGNRHSVKYIEDIVPGDKIDANFATNGLDRNLLNTSYWLDAGVGKPIYEPFSLGTNCWFLNIDPSSTSPNNFISGNNIYSLAHKGFSRQSGQSYNDEFLDENNVATDNVIELPLFDLCKFVNNQYGGASYEAISNTNYISTGHFQPYEEAALGTSLDVNVYGGDTFVSYYDAEIYQPYYRGSDYGTPNSGGEVFPDPTTDEYKMSVAWFFPVETPYNPMLRTSRHFSHNRDASTFNLYDGDTNAFNLVYTQQNNGEKKFFGKNFLLNTVEEFPNRLWVSENKTNGELIDSWRSFKDVNYLDVEGTYGDINKVINFKDTVFFLQDRGLGSASINQRSLIQDSSGIQLSLGTGGVIDDFNYISTNSGTKDQFSVTQTNSALYYYDRLNEKVYRLAGDGNIPLSDVQGMHSYFRKIDKNIYSTSVSTGFSSFTDNTSITDRYRGAGVHSVYDKKNNVVLFTFLNPFVGALPTVEKGETLPPFTDGFTIAYNENINAFESFYDFIPTLYKEHKGNLFSISPIDRNSVYVHNEGNRGEFYGKEYPTEVTTLFNVNPDLVKVFNNLEWNSETTDASGNDLEETVETIQTYNEYQDSGIISLTASNLRKRMRTWRMYFPRDNKARMRSQSVFVKFTKSNNNNKRFVLHDLIISFFNKMF